MQVILLLAGTFALYCLSAKLAAHLLGRLALSWASAAAYAGISILVSGVVAATPLSRLFPIGPTSVGTLLILPVTLGAGSWYLRRHMQQRDGVAASWGKCVAVAAIPFLLIAVLGIVAAILLPLLRR